MRLRFRKKPIEVEAIHHAPGVEFPLAFLRGDEDVRQCAGSTSIEVRRDGSCTVAIAREGDWLIRHADGRLYTMDDVGFRATYEPATAPAPPALDAAKEFPDFGEGFAAHDFDLLSDEQLRELALVGAKAQRERQPCDQCERDRFGCVPVAEEVLCAECILLRIQQHEKERGPALDAEEKQMFALLDLANDPTDEQGELDQERATAALGRSVESTEYAEVVREEAFQQLHTLLGRLATASPRAVLDAEDRERLERLASWLSHNRRVQIDDATLDLLRRLASHQPESPQKGVRELAEAWERRARDMAEERVGTDDGPSREAVQLLESCALALRGLESPESQQEGRGER